MPPTHLINDILPDELLLQIFAALPCVPARVPKGAVTLGSLGAAERTCSRWRRLALGLAGQHEVHIWCLDSTGHMITATAGELKHCLDARSPAVVALHEPTDAVRALLLGLHLPAVRRLAIQGCDDDALHRSLPRTFPALEDLRTYGFEDMHDTGVAETYPSAFRLLPSLKSLDIVVMSDIIPDLTEALLAMPQLESVRLTLDGPLPGAAAWQQLGQLGPLLRHVSLSMRDLGGRVPPELFGLPATVDVDLSIRVSEPGEEWEGLQRLPSLRRLELQAPRDEGWPVPSSCWACSHLTALCLSHFLLEVPAGTAATLSTLHRLELRRVDLPIMQCFFPEEFCLLPQLAGLQLEGMPGPCLSTNLSQLSNLMDLSLVHLALDPAGLLVMPSLTALTHLQLKDCTVRPLPAAPIYPASLAQLTVTLYSPDSLYSLLSPALFVSPTLQRLNLTVRYPNFTEKAHLR